MNKTLVVVWLGIGIGCGGKTTSAPANTTGTTQTQKASDEAGGKVAFECISNNDADNCAYGGPVDVSTATQVPGEGRSATCIGQKGGKHNCAYEREPLVVPHDPSKPWPTIGSGAGTGNGSATP